jgi:hypothetical protein
MMLFVGGKDQIVENLAAGDGRIVPQYRMDEPGPVFQVAVVSKHKTNRHHPIK